MIQLYNEDCLDVLKDMEAESVDLILTDCPYRIVTGGCTTGAYGNDKGKTEFDTIDGQRVLKGTKHAILGGVLDDTDPNTYMKNGKLFKHNDIKFEEWLPLVYRILRKGKHCYIMVNARNLAELQTKAEKVGFEYQQLLIWDKGNATPNRYYLNAFECILMLRKGEARNINDMGTKNILTIPNIIGKQLHPAEKPPELMEILIANSTDEGEIVCDPFMGAGSTGVACKRLKRNFIGIDKDERYYNITKARIDITNETEVSTNAKTNLQVSIFDLT